jgi:glycosyltransferase involved in cell wall biosynthesis
VESSEAASIVRGLAPDVPTTVIPSGVDIEQFAGCPGSGNGPTVILSTSLKDPNEFADAGHFCRTIVPLVRARVPKVRIVIASKGSMLFGRKSDLVGVEVIAPVTDLRPLFHADTVAVAPLRAGGDVRSSVLEPMAAGVPVVATSRVRDRLGEADTRVLRVGGESADVALAVIQLLQDASGRAAMAERGRAYVITTHGWSVLAQKVGEIVDGAVRPRRAADARPGTAGSDLPLSETIKGDAR